MHAHIGGEESNTSPTQEADRFAINLSDLSLSEAGKWPELFQLVQERVKPERDRMGGYSVANSRRENWWKYGTPASDLAAAISGMSRCLVTARVSKHLMMCFQPTTRIFSEQVYVFPFERTSNLAVLQSRIHEFWARLLSSSMKTDLRYAASDCFETFPFPSTNPRDALPKLEASGAQLHEARALFMVETNQGLTKTYNSLKDPTCDDARILKLRRLHEEMDRAVLDAYGWTDIEVPPYCPKDDVERVAVKTFEDETIDRLFVLNAERASAEHAAGPGKSKPATTGRTKNSSANEQKLPTKRAKKKAAGSDTEGQGSLF